mgnify:CR=1 FL=1
MASLYMLRELSFFCELPSTPYRERSKNVINVSSVKITMRTNIALFRDVI